MHGKRVNINRAVFIQFLVFIWLLLVWKVWLWELGTSPKTPQLEKSKVSLYRFLGLLYITVWQCYPKWFIYKVIFFETYFCKDSDESLCFIDLNHRLPLHNEGNWTEYTVGFPAPIANALGMRYSIKVMLPFSETKKNRTHSKQPRNNNFRLGIKRSQFYD